MTEHTAIGGLAGLRILSLESRRAQEMTKLIENYGGIAILAPSMREVPLRENVAALAFADRLLRGEIDIAVFLTGVGTRLLLAAAEVRYPRTELVAALGRVCIVARGPKPLAVLREFGVPVHLAVPEPNTWRDLLAALDHYQPPLLLRGKTVAIQEYGARNLELVAELKARGATVLCVPVYQWALPEDVAPLRQAVQETIQGRIDVLLITSATQIHHLMQVAAAEGLEGRLRTSLERVVIASIGPISSEALRAYGMEPDLEPSHPKMGQLVFETAEKAKALRLRKLPATPDRIAH